MADATPSGREGDGIGLLLLRVGLVGLALVLLVTVNALEERAQREYAETFRFAFGPYLLAFGGGLGLGSPSRGEDS